MLSDIAGKGIGKERQGTRIRGEVVIRSTELGRSLSIVACAVIAGPLLFAALVKYSRKETVTGWLVPEQGIIRVVAREGGVLENLAVEEGEAVRRGQPIGTLRITASTKDAQDAPEVTERNMAAEMAAQRALTALTVAESRQKHAGIVEQRDSLRRQIDRLVEGRGRVLAQLAVSANNLERSRELAERGFVSKQRFEEMQVTHLGFQREAAAAQAAIEGLRAQLAALDTEARTLLNERGTIAARAAAEMAQLEQRRLAAETQNQYVVTAPLAGRIAALPLQVNQVANPASTVAIVIPASSKLLAELYVPSRAAGFIRPGQRVRLMYDSYPYEKYGAGEGTIRQVSAALLAPGEVAMPGRRGDEAVFRVRVELSRPAVRVDGRDIPLQPGATLKADIIIERRTLLEWLLEPMFRAQRRA